MSLDAFLRTIVGVLDEGGVPYMLTGSLASAYYATPRATQDVDVVIEIRREQVDELVERLVAAGLYASGAAAREALRLEGQFNAVDPGAGWKADFIIRKSRPFSREEFGRRRQARLLGTDVFIATAEDLLLAKLEWAGIGDSAIQRRDALDLLQARGDALDRAYVERWAGELGVGEEWRRLLESSEGGEPPPAG